MRNATDAIFRLARGEISLLYTLFYIAASVNESTPGTFRNFNTKGGAEETRFHGDAWTVPFAPEGAPPARSSQGW